MAQPYQVGIRGWSPLIFSTSVDKTVTSVRSGSVRSKFRRTQRWASFIKLCLPCTASVSGINAQARRLQRSRAKGTPALASEGAQSPPTPRLRRTVSESSLSSATTPGPEERGQETMRYSLYESPHLLLLQGYSQQHVSAPPCAPTKAQLPSRELTRRARWKFSE